MVKVRKDVAKNRLYINISGTLSLSDAGKAKELIINEVEALKPGFDLINDISKFIIGDESAGAILKEIMILLIQRRVNRVVRIVGTSKTGLIQFANHSLAIEAYKLYYLPTLEEAEKFLNE